MSAVIVAVPEAEPLVGRLRAELDPSAADGVPAHVTVMFPFLAPIGIDEGVLASLAGAVAEVSAFTATFGRVAWFGEQAVFLVPEPAAPFVALTVAVQARFGLAPYGGAHDEIVPHLTVGHGAPLERLQTAAADLEPGLPVRASIRSAHLIVGTPGAARWVTAAELPLRVP